MHNCGISAEIDILCLMILAMILFSYRGLQNQLYSKPFLLLIYSLVIFTFADLATILLSESYVNVLIFASGLKLYTWLFSILCWFLYIYQKIESSSYAIKKWMPLIILPIVLQAVYATIDMVHGYIQGTFVFNNFIWIGICVNSFIYTFAATCITLHKARISTHSYEKKHLYFLSVIMFVPLLSLPLQAYLGNIPITPPIFTLTILNLSIAVARRNIIIDEKTKTNNSIRLDYYLEEIVQKTNPSKRLFYVQIGIDNFYEIKDKFGNYVISKLLEGTGDFLKKQCHNQHAFLAHSSVNTFAIILETENFSEIDEFCNEILQNSKTDAIQEIIAWPITFNVYYSEYESKKTIDQWVSGLKEHCIKPPTPIQKE